MTTGLSLGCSPTVYSVGGELTQLIWKRCRYIYKAGKDLENKIHAPQYYKDEDENPSTGILGEGREDDG